MRYRILAGLVLASVVGTVQASQVDAAAASLRDRVIQWRRDFHEHPELGNRETRTAARVAEHLRSLGLEVKTGIASTGVVAVLKGGKPGPRIALRADMDALPVTERSGLPFASKATAQFNGETVGVMHACGHDAHTSILMGVAQALAEMKDELPGEVLFVFQPAEEGPPAGEKGGAEEMLAQGIFRDFKPEAVFGLHVFSTLNAGQIGLRSGPVMAAADSFEIVVRGRQTHGSRPWGGVDPIVAAAEIVGSAQAIVSRRQDISRLPVVVSFGAIRGGVRFNIIPDEVKLVGTIRTFDDDMRAQVFADLRNVANHVAAAHGASATVDISEPPTAPMTRNDPALVEKMRASLVKAAGTGNVVDPGLNMGAEDFSHYANAVPGMFFFVGATPKDRDPLTAPSNHSPEFFLDESALDLGLRALLQVAVDYLHGAAAKDVSS
ncbi:MAG: amidohydrolase [Pseudoxanthomonas sp.]